MPTLNKDIISLQTSILRLEIRGMITYSFWDPGVGSNTLWWGVEIESLPEALHPFHFHCRIPAQEASRGNWEGWEGNKERQRGRGNEAGVGRRRACRLQHSFTHSTNNFWAHHVPGMWIQQKIKQSSYPPRVSGQWSRNKVRQISMAINGGKKQQMGQWVTVAEDGGVLS